MRMKASDSGIGTEAPTMVIAILTPLAHWPLRAGAILGSILFCTAVPQGLTQSGTSKSRE